MTGLQSREVSGVEKRRRQRQSSIGSSPSSSLPSSPRDNRESEEHMAPFGEHQALEESPSAAGKRLRNALFKVWSTEVQRHTTTADSSSTDSSSGSEEESGLQGRRPASGSTDTNRRKLKIEGASRGRSHSLALNSSAQLPTRSSRRSSVATISVGKGSGTSPVEGNGGSSSGRKIQRRDSMKRESPRGSPKGSSSGQQTLPPLPSLVGLMLFRKLYLAKLEKGGMKNSAIRPGEGRGSMEAIDTVGNAQDSHPAHHHKNTLSAEELGELPKEPRFCSTLSPAAQLAMLQSYEEKLQATTCTATDTDRQMELVEATLEELLSGEEGDDSTGMEKQLQASRLFEKAMRLLDEATRRGEEQDKVNEAMFQLTRKTVKGHRVSFKLD